jgi:zinc transport system permease protein
MSEALSQPFMQRALIAGVLVAVLSGYFGVFVVQRGLAFLGDGLAHAAFGGVALAFLLGTEPLWIAVPFTVAVAVGITWVQGRTRLAPDTAVGVFFSVSVALGVIFLSMVEGYTVDAFTFLFGSILAVTWSDIWTAAATALVTLVAFPVWGRWAFATFDRELALAERLPTRGDDYLLNIFVAVVVVTGVRLVGIVMITAFLVIPAATARLFSPTLAAMTRRSILLGIVSVLGGLLASYRLDLPSGATIILGQALLFFGATVSTLTRRR